jgi:ABC-type transporter Mla MlaB component
VMFKIEKSSNGKSVVFTLSGRIKAVALTELQKLLKGEAGDHNVALDLKDVKLVDRDAVIFLASCEAKGMKVANCSPYIREWIEKEVTQSEER